MRILLLFLPLLACTPKPRVHCVAPCDPAVIHEAVAFFAEHAPAPADELYDTLSRLRITYWPTEIQCGRIVANGCTFERYNAVHLRWLGGPAHDALFHELWHYWQYRQGISTHHASWAFIVELKRAWSAAH